MHKSQWIVVLTAIAAITILFFLVKTTPSIPSKTNVVTQKIPSELSIDTILFHAKEKLQPEQNNWLGTLELSITRGDVKKQQLAVYHQLAHFWKDSVPHFEPYAWYEAEAARLENSEKNLTFAAHLFLDNLRGEENHQLKQWKALQAKDLFERSLKINAENDSSQVGLGACFIFGAISENPMEGIQKILKVVEKDSTNVFAQLILGHGSVISGQYDKAIIRFSKVAQLQPTNLEAIVMLAEVFERKSDKTAAIKWYRKAATLVNNPDVLTDIENRIADLSK